MLNDAAKERKERKGELALDGRTMAKLRDEFLASAEGVKCCEVSILRDPTHQRFLRNRIEEAFRRGMLAAFAMVNAELAREGGFAE